ncbi:NFACT family protein [Candidatus Woesearchaeota archaeon]|nr:NFACT family protein [Candidatus Woesearchaeota archaeon]
MKTEISSLELHFLLKEFETVMGAKLEQVYQVGKEELVLQLHVPGVGKKILRVIIGKLMYIASNKGDMPEKPPGFCLYLRKKLKNARLKEVQQLGFERIVSFLFETKDLKFRLVIELFSKGNIVLCSEDWKILSALEKQEWKDRSIKPGEQYSYPKKEFNFLTITAEQLADMLHKSDKENLVKSLALDLGLGGVYAEELCMLAGIEKGLKSAQLSDKEVKSVFDAITNLKDKQISTTIYKVAEGQIKDIVPFELKFYKDLQKESAEMFNEALDKILTTKIEKKAIDSAENAAKTKIGKIEEMISQQRLRISGLEVSEKDNQRKGELIYENYPLIQQVIEQVKELRKTLSWKEVKEHFKGHKLIKGVDEKTGEVTLEL